MKLLDRYLMRTLLVPLFYCLLAFVLLYVIFDLFDNLSDFVKAGTPLLQVVGFYAMLLPAAMIFIVPVSLLLAVLYSLSQLTKNSELTAMRACGLSIYRLMIPFMATGFMASLLVLAINETLGPWASYRTDQFLESQKRQETYDAYTALNLAYKNVVDNRIWMIQVFDTRSYEMRNLELIQQYPDGRDKAHIRAERARWLDGRWWFTGVVTQQYGPEGHPLGPPVEESHREMRELTETPRDFINEIKDPIYLSSAELLQFLQTHEGISEHAAARIMVDFHQRLAMPWTCFVVTLLGIPFGSHTGRKGALVGISLSLLLFFGLYTSINIGLMLGKKQLIAPWIAGWAPNLVFTAIGCFLVRRIR